MDRPGAHGELAPRRGRRLRGDARRCSARARARAARTWRRSAARRSRVEAVNERERVTDHDVAAFVDVLGALGGAGRALDPLRPDLLRRARHGAGAAAARGRRGDPARAPTRSSRRSHARAREHVDTLCVGRTHGVHAEPTTFGIKLAGFAFEAHRNAAAPASAPSSRSPSARSPAPSAPTRRPARSSRRACSRAWGWRARTSPRRSSRATATPSCCGDRARRRRPGAPGDRGPPPAAHRGARGAGAVSRRARRARSAMPHKRNPIKAEQISGLARVLRGNAQAALGERRAVARARHLATPRSSA